MATKAAFSGTISLSDLNDYIAPSQACVVALNGGSQPLKVDANDLNEVRIQPRGIATAPQFPPPQQQLAPGSAVKVTLHDCLACSGCITSAETVLLQHQSGEEFVAKLADSAVAVVVSVAPQSWAALAALYELPLRQAVRRLTGALLGLGVRAVLDIGSARDVALMETAAEFLDRYDAANGGTSSSAMAVDDEDLHGPGPLPLLASACPGWVCYAEKTHGEAVLPHLSTAKSPQAVMGSLVKRLGVGAWGVDPRAIYHASIMPCYDKKLEAAREELTLPGSSVAEVDSCLATVEVQQLLLARGIDLRTAPEATPLPLLSLISTGSSQLPAPSSSISNRLIHTTSHINASGFNGTSNGAMHTGSLSNAAAPTHDFSNAAMDTCSQDQIGVQAEFGSTTNTLGHPSHGNGQHHHVESRIHPMTGAATGAGALLQPPMQSNCSDLEEEQLMGWPGGSGGYMEYVFRVAAKALFGRELPPGKLPTRTLRNADMQELVLEGEDGRVLLRFAAAYGFRNIQTLMRKLKIGKCEYSYVEVMACPGGCLNGGGQPKAALGQTTAQRLEQLEWAYTSDVTARAPHDSPLTKALYSSIVPGGCYSPAARQLFHTTYRQREKTVTAAIGDW